MGDSLDHKKFQLSKEEIVKLELYIDVLIDVIRESIGKIENTVRERIYASQNEAHDRLKIATFAEIMHFVADQKKIQDLSIAEKEVTIGDISIINLDGGFRDDVLQNLLASLGLPHEKIKNSIPACSLVALQRSIVLIDNVRDYYTGVLHACEKVGEWQGEGENKGQLLEELVIMKKLLPESK